MKCSKCEYRKDNPNKTISCLQTILEMDITCLMRHFLWRQMAIAGLTQKTEKLIDKMEEDLDQGEEWKKDNENPKR